LQLLAIRFHPVLLDRILATLNRILCRLQRHLRCLQLPGSSLDLTPDIGSQK
jgi:hypothetical protein